MRRVGNSRNFIIGSLVLLVLPSCAKNKSAPPGNLDQSQSGNLDNSRLKASSSQVDCEVSTGCSPAVGMLVSALVNSVSQCTAFLIGPDLAATSRECLPEDLQRGGSDCSGRMWVFFPEVSAAGTEYAANVIECSQVLAASNPQDPSTPVAKAGDFFSQPNYPDYAFLRLKSPGGRPPLALSREGFAEWGNFQIMKVDPDPHASHPTGHLTSESCLPIYETQLAPGVVDPKDRVMTLGDCPLVAENAGSPLIGSDGKVHGIAFAFLNPQSRDLSLQSPFWNLFEQSAAIALATNFACLDVPTALGDFERTASDCKNIPQTTDATPDSENTGERGYSAAVMSALAQDPEFTALKSSTPVQWAPHLLNSDSAVGGPDHYSNPDSPPYARYVPFPICMDPKLSDPGFWQGLWGVPASATLAVKALPVWDIEKGANRYFQRDFRIHRPQAEPSFSGSIQYSPEDLVKNRDTLARYFGVNLQGNSEALLAADLSVCVP